MVLGRGEDSSLYLQLPDKTWGTSFTLQIHDESVLYSYVQTLPGEYFYKNDALLSHRFMWNCVSYICVVFGVQPGSPICISKDHVQVRQASQHALISRAAVQVGTPVPGSRHAGGAALGPGWRPPPTAVGISSGCP